jgi:predicted Zn-dependent protease
MTPSPVLGPKARLRIGIVHYEVNRLDDSRREIAEALGADLHPFDRYLAHLVLGLGFNAQKRPDDARREFAAAVAIDPGVISGAMELSAHQFAIGLRTEGSAAMDRALAAEPPRDDPWQRPCAFCAGWTERLNSLREGVKR